MEYITSILILHVVIIIIRIVDEKRLLMIYKSKKKVSFGEIPSFSCFPKLLNGIKLQFL